MPHDHDTRSSHPQALRPHPTLYVIFGALVVLVLVLGYLVLGAFSTPPEPPSVPQPQTDQQRQPVPAPAPPAKQQAR